MGIQLGNIIAFPVSGVICQYLGWSWVFYTFGVGGTIWFIFWTLYAFDKPSNNPRISQKERLYIENSLRNELTRKKVIYINVKFCLSLEFTFLNNRMGNIILHIVSAGL
ncbi:sialin [Oopsacas minuta]|uniref:Sialin n=1 Tax=Oopsacas minuta TaxID=111878 RepID=A0AAV7JJA2_9METZ|nr:sialin [Oopsacas minuta]